MSIAVATMLVCTVSTMSYNLLPQKSSPIVYSEKRKERVEKCNKYNKEKWKE